MGGRVAGKIALITGAAMGLGRATALLLAREGAKVAVADIDTAEAPKVAAAIEARGGEAIFIELDVADPAQWPSAIDAMHARFGRFDIMVNNAGVALAADIEQTSFEDWRWLMSVNLDGVFLGTRHAIAAMKETGGGSIINLSSMDGLIGEVELAAYCASKGGVRLLTKAAALHCAKAGYSIRVNSVHPGYIHTPQVEKYLRDLGDAEVAERRISALHPLGRMGEPNDIAYAILYLASDESKFATGSELVVDGGYTAQ